MCWRKGVKEERRKGVKEERRKGKDRGGEKNSFKIEKKRIKKEKKR
jgi:hypothetical protein